MYLALSVKWSITEIAPCSLEFTVWSRRHQISHQIHNYNRKGQEAATLKHGQQHEKQPACEELPFLMQNAKQDREELEVAKG